MTVIGNAEILVHANTAGFAAEVESSTAPAFKAVEAEAAVAGEKSGAALGRGMKAGSAEASSSATGLSAVVRKASLGITAAIVGTAAVGVHMAEGMQQSEAAIASATHVSVSSAHQISQALLGTAGHSEFTGAKMEEAYAKVAAQLKATEGRTLSAKQATDFMTASSDLATAKQMDLGQATSTTASILQAFKMKASEAAHVTDVLYSTSNATGVEVGTLGSQLQRLRSRLGESAGSVGDMATILVDMTKSGITGRTAMSALSGAMSTVMKSSGDVTTTTQAQERAFNDLNPKLQELVHKYQTGQTTTKDFNAELGKLPATQQDAVKGFMKAAQASDNAQAKFKSLGIEVFDQRGKFVGMASIIDQLAPKFAHMTQEQKLAASQTLFGASAARQMVAIIDAGPAAYDRASRAVQRHGAVEQAAKTQSQTLHGEMKTLESTVGDLATKFGMVLIPALTTVIGVAAHSKAVLIALGVIAGGLAAKFIFTKAVEGIGFLVQAVQSAIGVMRTLAVTAIAGWEALGAVGKFAATAGAIGLVVGAIALFTGHQKSAQQASEDLTNALNAQRDALRQVRDLDLNAADAKLAARQSALSVADAEDQLSQSIQRSGRSSRATKEAEVQLDQARIQHKRDLRALTDVQGNATEAVDRAKDSIKKTTQAQYDHIQATKGTSAALNALPGLLDGAKAGLDKLSGSADHSKTSTLGVKTALGQIPSDVNSQINVDTSGAVTNIAALKSEIDSAVNSAINLGTQLAAAASKKPPHHEGAGKLRFTPDPYANQAYAGGVASPGGHGAVVAFQSDHEKKNAYQKAQDLVTQQKATLEKWIAAAKAAEAATKGVTKAQKAALEQEIIDKRAALSIQTRSELAAASKKVKSQDAALKVEATEQKSGQSWLNKLLTAIHSKSLTSLNNLLWQAHLNGLKDLETKLTSTHDKDLKALGKELVKIHQKAIDAQGVAKAAADAISAQKFKDKMVQYYQQQDQDNAAKIDAATRKGTDTNNAAIQAIQDSTKVNLDQMAEKAQQSTIDTLTQQLQDAKSGGKDTKDLQAQLDAANAEKVSDQAQTSLDTITQTWNATIATAQQAVDDSWNGTAVAQANAAQALAAAQNSAALAEAQQQSTVEIDQALSSAAQSAAQAAAQAANSVDTSTPDTGTGDSTTTTTPGPAPIFNFQINGHGMTAADLFAEVGWALKTGALPVGTPT